ncbi:MAG TPA: hypothetical protein VFU36_17620, partial [Jatrophihabitans sp.]|nr:hypothetical protein [Jatrophihabitans sp.]
PASSDSSLELVDELPDEPAEQASASLVGEWEALEAEAEFAHVLHGGRAVTAESVRSPDGRLPDEDEQDFLGLPGLLTAEQTAALLAQRDGELRKRASRSRQVSLFERDEPAAEPVDPVPGAAAAPSRAGWRAAAELRREVNRLVAVLAARTGTPHGQLHARLRAAVPGPPTSAAPVELLEARREHLMAQL